MKAINRKSSRRTLWGLVSAFMIGFVFASWPFPSEKTKPTTHSARVDPTLSQMPALDVMYKVMHATDSLSPTVIHLRDPETNNIVWVEDYSPEIWTEGSWVRWTMVGSEEHIEYYGFGDKPQTEFVISKPLIRGQPCVPYGMVAKK